MITKSIYNAAAVLLAIASVSTITGMVAYQAGREAEAEPAPLSLHTADDRRRQLLQDLAETHQQLASARVIVDRVERIEAWTVAHPGWMITMTCEPSGLCSRMLPSDQCWRVMVFSPSGVDRTCDIETGNGMLETVEFLLPDAGNPKRNAPYAPVASTPTIRLSVTPEIERAIREHCAALDIDMGAFLRRAACEAMGRPELTAGEQPQR